MATKNAKKISPHTNVFRALISAANAHFAKANFSGKQIAAPMGALLMTEGTQRPFVRPLAKPRRVFLWQLVCLF
jgi:hypothetical protein